MAKKVAYLIGTLAAATSIVGLMAADVSAQERRRDRRDREAAAVTPATPQVSPAFGATYAPVNTAITVMDWPTADAALAIMRAAAVSPYELYLTSQTEFRIAAATGNVERQLIAVDGMIDSNGTPATDNARVLVAGGQLAYNARQYAKAAQRIEAAQAAGATTAGLDLLRLDALIRSDQIDAGVAYGNQLITAASGQGGVASDDIFGLVARALQDADRNAELAAVLTRRTAAYPTEGNFRSTVLAILQSTPEDRGRTIDLMRLMHAAGAMNDRRYYLEYVGNLVEEGLPNESVTVIQHGRASGTVEAGDATFNEIEATQRDKLADDRASLPGTERRAAAAADSRLARLVGDAYLGYSNYPKAEEMYQLALTKAGVDTDLIHTRIGIARLGAGNFAGALESFALVQNEPRASIARLWEALVRRQMPAPAAAAPANPPVPAAPAPSN